MLTTWLQPFLKKKSLSVLLRASFPFLFLGEFRSFSASPPRLGAGPSLAKVSATTVPPHPPSPETSPPHRLRHHIAGRFIFPGYPSAVSRPCRSTVICLSPRTRPPPPILCSPKCERSCPGFKSQSVRTGHSVVPQLAVALPPPSHSPPRVPSTSVFVCPTAGTANHTRAPAGQGTVSPCHP